MEVCSTIDYRIIIIMVPLAVGVGVQKLGSTCYDISKSQLPPVCTGDST